MIKFSTFQNLLQSVCNNNHVKRTFRIGCELFAACQPLIEQRSLWNVTKTAFEIGKIFVNDTEVWADNYFSNDEWTAPFTSSFDKIVIDLLKNFPKREIETANDHKNLIIVSHPKFKAGWVLNVSTNEPSFLYVESSKLEVAQKEIKDLLWRQYKNSSLLLKRTKNNLRFSISNKSSFVDEIEFQIDNLHESKQSAQSANYSKYIKKYIDENLHRSVMLYGPPGTGKSTMARTVVDTLKLKSFRFNVEDVDVVGPSTLYDAINIFEPDAIIIDDFDRINHQNLQLEILEFFQKKVKLIIATVNDINNFDKALIRPGRFDELVKVDVIDEEIVKHLLGDYVDAFEVVKKWPIAYIQEYIKRRHFMTREEAQNSINELAVRIQDASSYEYEDDLLKVLNNKKNKRSIIKKSLLQE